MKVEAIEYGDRRVYSVAAFNRGVGDWLARLPTVWVEGEVTELRRQDRWQSVFLTLKDPADGACLGVTMPRGQFDALRLDLHAWMLRPGLRPFRRLITGYAGSVQIVSIWAQTWVQLPGTLTAGGGWNLLPALGGDLVAAGRLRGARAGSRPRSSARSPGG